MHSSVLNTGESAQPPFMAAGLLGTTAAVSRLYLHSSIGLVLSEQPTHTAKANLQLMADMNCGIVLLVQQNDLLTHRHR
ncbi:MAG TPA: hypothetical protein VFQ47_10670 [Nitrososphaera sp.]|nr:hypothetical protein [Nitrososphaera sp.]